MMKIFSFIVDFPYIDFAYFFPGAMAAMLIKMLLNDRLSGSDDHFVRYVWNDYF